MSTYPIYLLFLYFGVNRNQKTQPLPISMCGIIGEIGEQGLINVKNPRVFAIVTEFHTLGILLRLLGHHFQIHQVPFPRHVLLHVLHALLRHRLPLAKIVRLPSHAPRATPQAYLLRHFRHPRVLHYQRPRKHAVLVRIRRIGIRDGKGAERK
ncbi:hypothetical protein V8G54_022590 [Vigna mungo]|uniref:Uncharacterized protein n=1 Tax=Vigna mungo TaxID=3915 RepID=A0AAQ3N2S3_VIGMU